VQATVDDRATKLMWQACPTGVGESDCKGPVKGTAAGAARAHCEGLNWAGFSDWRLGTFKELFGLLNLTDAGTFPIDRDFFGPSSGTYSYLISSDGLVNIIDGKLTGIGEGMNYPTYCVRGPLL
jgi:hypothetical protein